MVNDDNGAFDQRLDRACAGDEALRGALLTENRSWLKRMAARALGPKLGRWHDPSDVAQECLLVADRKLNRFRGRGSATFRAWLKGIQRNLVRKLLSRQLPKAEHEVALPHDSASGPLAEAAAIEPLAQLLVQENVDLLRQALEALEIEDRRLIEQRFLHSGQDEPGYDELARELGTNAVKLRQRLCRLLQRLESGMTLLEQLSQRRVAPHYRRVLCWRHFRAWPVARIAAELGCPEPAAKSLLKRADEQLSRNPKMQGSP